MTHILSMHNQATEIFSQHCSPLRLRAPPTQLSEGSRLPSRSHRQHHPSARLLASVRAVAALVTIAAGDEVDFRAMGAVVPQQMMEVPYRDNASVAINFSYQLASLGTTVASVVNRSADFGVVDSFVPAAVLNAHPSLFQVPLLATAITPCVNLPTLAADDVVVLTRETLAEMYAGTVRFWDDAAIAASNPALAQASKLPHVAITVFAIGVSSLGR